MIWLLSLLFHNNNHLFGSICSDNPLECRGMTREENQEVEFYKSDLIQQMLQDDLLCDDDKRIVRAAVLTSRKNPPNMTLIREADMLLKELAQTRTATNPPKTISTVDATQYNHITKKDDLAEQQFWNTAHNVAMSKMYMIMALGAFVLMFGYKYLEILAPSNLHTFQEAKEKCKKRGQFLPKDWKSASYLELDPEEINVGYWGEDSSVFHNGEQGTTTDDGKEHYAICVDKLQTF